MRSHGGGRRHGGGIIKDLRTRAGLGPKSVIPRVRCSQSGKETISLESGEGRCHQVLQNTGTWNQPWGGSTGS